MGRLNTALLAFNRGLISPLALARTDIDRVRLHAEEQDNWMPRILGSMQLRPGLEYIGATEGNKKAMHIDFVFSLDDQATIELTENKMRVRVDDAVITRNSVSSAVTNGGFNTDLSSWTDSDEGGTTSQWVTGGFMGLEGTGANYARRRQQVTVSGGDANTEHGIKIVVERGSVRFRVGSSAGGFDYVDADGLRPGEYSFAFTPASDFHIEIASTTTYESLVDSVSVESSGDMVIATDFSESDLDLVRWDQSGDVIFLACEGKKQYRIERRGTKSWGIADYVAESGPFRNINLSPTTLTPSAISGDITITASSPVFASTNVGSYYRLTTSGQQVTANLATDNTFTDSIRVTGTGGNRAFTVSISGTWSATITLQRSVGDDTSWEDTGTTYTGNTTVSFNDGLDNQIIFYRIGIKTGDYTSGTATTTLTYSFGSSSGVALITGFTNSTSVSAAVVDDLGGTAATSDWEEGGWSDRRGYPSSVTIYEGRLWWAGKDNIYGSVSDDFTNYDDTVEGDSAPIIRSIGSGPVDRINWLLPLQRLVIGAETSEKVARSTSLDEPLTVTDFNIKTPTTRGSNPTPPAQVDSSGFFARNNRLFQLVYESAVTDYDSVDITSFVPEVGGDEIVRIRVQRYPDTRIHCVRDDGKVALLIFDRNEDVRCWVTVSTDGFIEDVNVKPAKEDELEDSVYYTVRRVINGETVRYYEKFAFEADCVGGTQNKQADSFIAGTQSSNATITGLDHLEGEEVVVWANGKNYSPRVNGTQTTYTVTSGEITLSEAVTSYVVGLPYKAQYKSTKLAYGARGGTALVQKKRIEQLGVILRNAHNRALRYGSSFDEMYEMPLVEDGKVVDADKVWEEYDKPTFIFEQSFDTDSKLHLEAMAPMPVTLLAAVMTIETNEQL